MKSSTLSGDSSPRNETAHSEPTPKKKRNLPGMPDPDAEVIALSPKTLLATNRFVCEVCNKGFQRDQNLQLHRRGHNLPWKLRQRSSKDIKKRVYVCPESSCIHHDPLRALGDLTGIKKHFCRKHGEKKWKCDKCSKKYAVQSDWKAHLKICGTKEYKCDCGTLFSRRDNFITHRAYCEALAEENSKPEAANAAPNADEDPKIECVLSPSPPPTAVAPPLRQPSPPQTAVAPPLQQPSPPPAILPTEVVPYSSPDNNSVTELLKTANHNSTNTLILDDRPPLTNLTASCSSSSNGSSSSNIFASIFASSTSSRNPQYQTTEFTDLFRAIPRPEQQKPDASPPPSSEPIIALCLSMNQGSPIFGQYSPAPQPALSATALLQKAAQMGPTSSNKSLAAGLGLGLGLGLGCDGGSGLKELMLGTPSIFGPKHTTTLDLLGLGMAASSGAAAAQPFDNGQDS